MSDKLYLVAIGPRRWVEWVIDGEVVETWAVHDEDTVPDEELVRRIARELFVARGVS